MSFANSSLTEWDFLAALSEETGCGLLLDVNNVYVSSVNHEFDPVEYIRSVPHERVVQFHLAGHSNYGRYIIDTHSLLGPGTGEMEPVVNGTATVSAVERLGIYAHAYYARLLEVLREEFPVMVKTIGQEVFDSFAIGYLQEYPSRSYTLAELGRLFPQYLEESKESSEIEPGNEALNEFTDFLIDLARVGWTLSDVFDGTGIEGEELLNSTDFQQIPANDWGQVSLVPVPCLRLMRTRFPVNAFSTAVIQERDNELPPREESFMAITRRDYVVHRYELEADEYQLLEAPVEGQNVERAIETLARQPGMDFEELLPRLQDWFARWTATGFFLSAGL